MNYPHWYYFVSLIDDLERTSRYVEIHPDNYRVFSIELTRLLLATCSEIDVVAKLLCTRLQPATTCGNIDEYRQCITSAYPSFSSIEVKMMRHGISFVPWESWKSGTSPSWWKSYNNVKHERSKFFQEANLGNAIWALGGFAVLITYFHHNELAESKFTQIPKFICVDPKYNRGSVMHGQPVYHMPDFPKK